MYKQTRPAMRLILILSFSSSLKELRFVFNSFPADARSHSNSLVPEPERPLDVGTRNRALIFCYPQATKKHRKRLDERIPKPANFSFRNVQMARVSMTKENMWCGRVHVENASSSICSGDWNIDEKDQRGMREDTMRSAGADYMVFSA